LVLDDLERRLVQRLLELGEVDLYASAGGGVGVGRGGGGVPFQVASAAEKLASAMVADGEGG
jgi:hypothetical protein